MVADANLFTRDELVGLIKERTRVSDKSRCTPIPAKPYENQ